MRLRLLLCAALVCFVAAKASAAEQDKLELKDGDRVVFLGNTLIEREQKYGYWELMLTMAWPERNVTFRNLGWSGDTVWGESRAGFGTQADGFKKLVDEVNAAKPTVIFVGYGNVEAFAGEPGLPKFVDGFNQLLDVLEATKARIVVLGPIVQATHRRENDEWHEIKSSFLTAYNESVQRYSDEMEPIARKRKLLFVELSTASSDLGTAYADPDRFLTRAAFGTGTDLTDYGYIGLWLMAIYRQLGLPESHENVVLKLTPYRTYRGIVSKPLSESLVTSLRESIVKKNELFFHRWRPQNETYLFGFRKHEQGKNAVEVFQFDPLVEAEEKKIAELRVKLAAEMKTNGEKKEQGAK